MLFKKATVGLLSVVFFLSFPLQGTAQTKPYRVLLVISKQWKDPRSFLVSGGGEFQTMVTLFKSWGVPFDILRLDQVLMDPNEFTDFEGRPRYGAIIWDGPDPISSSEEEFLVDAVEKFRTSLIVVGDRLQPPVIQRLLGIHSVPIGACY